jgi:hypothetical protein
MMSVYRYSIFLCILFESLDQNNSKTGLAIIIFGEENSAPDFLVLRQVALIVNGIFP